MKKLLMNRKPVNGPWGGGNLFVKAIVENAEKHGWEVVHKMQLGLDAILMVDPRYDELGISANEIAAYKKQWKDVRVIHRVNECDARKGTSDMDNMLRACSSFTDATVFVSNWMKEYHQNGWKTEEQYVVYNGVNSEHFYPLDEDVQYYKKNLYKALKVPVKLVAHHWSNNKMKGFDIYEQLDEWVGKNAGYEFIYIGRHNGTFKNATIINPLFGRALGKELALGDVYVSASRWDPGPNHIIEALACEIPTFVHKDGGGAVEFAGENAVYSSFEDLVLRIQQYKYPEKRGWNISWEDCADEYFSILENKDLSSL